MMGLNLILIGCHESFSKNVMNGAITFLTIYNIQQHVDFYRL
jgi:hypothetical protein